VQNAWNPARTRVHSLAIELTAFCNQHCDYCYNAWRQDGGASVGTPAIDKLLARIDRVLEAVSLEHVTITGGEPLASKDVFRVLDHLRAKHVKAQMISNGALVTEEIAAKLAKRRLMAVLVTLNGPDAALHDGLVGGKHFDDTVRGIGLLRKARVPVEGSIVITRRNADRVGETLRLLLSLGVRKVALSRFSPAGYSTALARELMPSRQDVTKALDQAVAIARAEKERVLLFSTMPIPPCALERERFPEIDFHDCPIGTAQQEFALGPHGEIRHCALHRDAIEKDVLAPSVDVAKIFASGDPHRYRAVLPTYCEGCEHASVCGGGCGAAALWVKGDHAVDPFVSWPESADAGPPKRRLSLVG
jgi:radical SAM protein with 4Fe4S-binding SPASM domain